MKVPCDSSLRKTELPQTCKRFRHEQKYEIDEIANHHGHIVVRLPPYHCLFNPIELIWVQVKSEIKKNSNANQNMKIVEEITKEAINNISSEKKTRKKMHKSHYEDERI